MDEQARLRAELAAVERELAEVTYALQRHQPPGSPPPGGAAALAVWVLDCARQARQAAEAERDQANAHTTEYARQCEEALRAYQEAHQQAQEWFAAKCAAEAENARLLRLLAARPVRGDL